MRRLVLPPFLALVAGIAALSPLATKAHADPAPVHFLGIQSGCERMPALERTVERRLAEKGLRVGLLSAPAGKEAAGCAGLACARRFAAACPGTGGRLLWGQAMPGRNVTKTRLFLYDLATQQSAVQDDYCQGCDLASAVTAHVEHLLQAPRFASAIPASGQPSYCAAPAASVSAASTLPLFLTVYGDGKAKAALLAALKHQLGLLGRRVLPLPGESRSYSSDILRKIVAGHPGAQVLGAEVQKDGAVLLFLYDSASDQTDGRTLPCQDCDRDQHIAQTKQAVAELLDKCFGERCSTPAAHSAAAPSTPPPPEACEPFPEATCSDATASGVLPPRHIDPTTAKLVKGALWGLTAATAATSIALFVADSAGAGTVADPNGPTIRDTLHWPAWAMAGTAVGLLAISLPITLVLNRATVLSRSSSPADHAGPDMSCPSP